MLRLNLYSVWETAQGNRTVVSWSSRFAGQGLRSVILGAEPLQLPLRKHMDCEIREDALLIRRSRKSSYSTHRSAAFQACHSSVSGDSTDAPAISTTAANVY